MATIEALRQTVARLEPHRGKNDRDWQHITTHPLAPLLETVESIEVKPENIRPGDLLLNYYDEWRLVLTTATTVGRERIFFHAAPDMTYAPMTPFYEYGTYYRLTPNMSFPPGRRPTGDEIVPRAIFKSAFTKRRTADGTRASA